MGKTKATAGWTGSVRSIAVPCRAEHEEHSLDKACLGLFIPFFLSYERKKVRNFFILLKV
jgi:hypothetical protein